MFSLHALSQVVDDQCAFFSNIELLKERPTHLLVFMQHVFLQFDPAPMVRTAAPITQVLIACVSVCVCVFNRWLITQTIVFLCVCHSSSTINLTVTGF